MKKLTLFVLALAATGAIACSSDTAKYNVKGVNAPEDGAYVYLVDPINSEPIDSAVVSGGVFQMKGSAPKDAFLKISNEASNWTFMMFNDGKPVKVDYSDNSLVGSSLNSRLSDCDHETDDILNQYNAFVNELIALPRDEQEAKMGEYEEWIQKLGDTYVNVVEENKDNLIPVAFVQHVRSLLGPDKFNELLDTDAPYAKHPYIVDMKRKIDESEAKRAEAEQAKQAIIGQKFLDLEEADPDGKMHKLSEYVGKGKWVLVDFWASWCGPCEAEMPNVVAAYKKYHKKGFDIVGLSFDREKEPWVKAIKDWDMPWIHLSDVKYWNSLAAQVYNVNSIPDNLLINPEGTVVARYLRGPALEAKLAEIFK